MDPLIFLDLAMETSNSDLQDFSPNPRDSLDCSFCFPFLKSLVCLFSGLACSSVDDMLENVLADVLRVLEGRTDRGETVENACTRGVLDV